MNSEELSKLQRDFERFWVEIRGANLAAGQPRSQRSAACVAIAREALVQASRAQDEDLLLQSWRMLYYTLIANEEYPEAIVYCRLAIGKCEGRGDFALASRLRIGYVAALTHAGQYEQAISVSAEAGRWMKENGDDIGYARLCTNIANVYHRLDQHARCLDYYQSALTIFADQGDRQAEAQVYLNLGNTLSQINRFEESDEMYRRSEAISNELSLADLWAQAHYNRAYLQYLRGRYSDALQAFGRLRVHFRESGSVRHSALCDLDETEIYLQLNLSTDAAALASRAITEFKEIGMTLESAKAHAFYGIALMQMRRFGEAVEMFRASQKAFREEGNDYWLAVLDLHCADVHLSLQRYWEAQALANRASQQFEALGMASSRIASLVLLARTALAFGNVQKAEDHAAAIFSLVPTSTTPVLLFPCHLLNADVAERKGDLETAVTQLGLAAEDLEGHHARLQHDDLKVTFLLGPNQIYESLVRLNLDKEQVATAYSWCERAKSRSLIQLLSHHVPSIQVQSQRSLISRINRLREELNIQYARSQHSSATPSRVAPEEVAMKERELARSLREIASSEPEYASLQQISGIELDTVQQFIPDGTTVIEYFSTQSEVMAFVISRDRVKVFRRLSPLSRVQSLQERLSFQLEKFLLGDEYIRLHSEQILAATNRHLQSLSQILIAPLLDQIQTSQVTIIPHGGLHFDPFHALFDGSSYLIDHFDIGYAPSASVLQYCAGKPEISGAEPVIVGVPDERVPMIEREIQSLHGMYPEATLLYNGAATLDSFTSAVERSSFLHIASHATLRQDNPMFSSFGLADGDVTAMDVFSFKCVTNLVTLSSCHSGARRALGGEDLMGLMRAFLYAGARSLLLSLWNISDESTALLMTSFYEAWREGVTKPQALKKAMQTTREAYPNPFHWAPFILVGKV